MATRAKYLYQFRRVGYLRYLVDLQRIKIQKTQHLCYHLAMNSKQMKKWLEQQGATFAQGKGSHLNIYLNEKKSVIPMHGTSEFGKGLEAAIKRQLGLK